MKKLLVVLILLPLIVALSGCGEDLQPRVDELEGQVAQLEQSNAELEERLAPPPEFLDSLFPPAAPFPILLVEMFGLSAPFEGLVLDLTEGDFENLAADFAAFKAQYEKLRNEITPEWKDLMPMEPIDALGAAVDSLDPVQIGMALGGVGAVCGQCHEANQLKVQLKYHWPDFGLVMLTDPVSGESVPWKQLMENMVLSYAGIGHELSQGQADKSLAHYDTFTSYFDTVSQGCSACHATPREYFVDARVQADVDALGEALQSATPDPAAIGGLLEKIGNESCFNCHLVHFPAAKTKAGWQE